jgi:cell filamentation protein
MSKKSIRFFNDREVRAVWDEEHSKWWFSATDIVRAINDEEDYVKAGNYWRWLKKKLSGDGVQLVSVTHDFKFEAPDGKQRFAGQIRTKTIWKDGTLFCRAEYLMQNLSIIEQMPETTFDEIVNKYVEMNVAHPFMEGNGRSTRIWLDLIFKKQLKLCVDWSKIDKKEYLEAMRRSTTDARAIKSLLQGAMTDRIDDREIFMKGIDYSYYYEQED